MINKWKYFIEEESKKEYFKKLKSTVNSEYEKYKVYPPKNCIFKAFKLTPFENVNIVILGQDPYHGEGQANGLAFSVNDGVVFPPSLLNIFKELKSDLGYDIPSSGNLEKWAVQGVLLLNTILTVRESKPLSHKGIGWEIFTRSMIEKIIKHREGVIFMLWGTHAQSIIDLIDTKKHFVLTSSHPSPYSAHKGFFGCRHFSKANELLKRIGKKEIDWKL